MSSTLLPPPREQLCNRSCSNKTNTWWVRCPNERNQGKQAHPVLKHRVPHVSQPRPGWVPDPPMVGIRSPIGLVVGSCTSHPEVLGSIPKREEPGKTDAPCVKVPGSSRVPAPPWWTPDPLMVGIRSLVSMVVGSCTRHSGVLGSIPKREEPGKTGAPCLKVPGSSRVPSFVIGLAGISNKTHKPQNVQVRKNRSPRRSAGPRPDILSPRSQLLSLPNPCHVHWQRPYCRGRARTADVCRKPRFRDLPWMYTRNVYAVYALVLQVYTSCFSIDSPLSKPGWRRREREG